MVGTESEPVYFSYNHVSIMMSQTAKMIFKMSAIFDPPTWISEFLNTSKNSSKIDKEKYKNTRNVKNLANPRWRTF